MLTQQILFSFNTANPFTKVVSLDKTTAIYDETNTLIASSVLTASFAPGDIQAVKDFMGTDTSPEIDYLNAIWA